MGMAVDGCPATPAAAVEATTLPAPTALLSKCAARASKDGDWPMNVCAELLGACPRSVAPRAISTSQGGTSVAPGVVAFRWSRLGLHGRRSNGPQGRREQ